MSDTIANPDRRIRCGDMRVAAQVALLQRIVPQQSAVIAAEPVAPIVAHAPLLRPPNHRLDLACVRPAAEVTPDQLRRLASLETADLASKQPTGTIDPVVQAVAEAVDASLVVVRRKSAEQLANHVRAAVGIGVFAI